jgi:hypothetical protein
MGRSRFPGGLMAGEYWKISPDGAKWRCVCCEELKPAELVILPKDCEGPPGIVCLECVDDEWFESAVCVGTK